MTDLAVPTQHNEQEIAIVGMAARLPGAGDVDAFWRNLRDGVESISFMTRDELIRAGVGETTLRNPNYVPACPRLEDIELFDAAFFGFSPQDAAIMDPQHRLFLECAWEALERAGYDSERYPGSIGIYAGAGMHSYLIYHLLSNRRLVSSVGEFLLRHTGNDKDFLSTRVSYNLNLRGPSVNVQTACSTSLVATHLACQALLNGECDMALAGGVTLNLSQNGYIYKDGEILSPDGHCRAFDADARGTIFGSGAGVVVLKRLKEAVADGDHIHAIIKGSAVNNDGSVKVGYLAPSVEGQAAVVAEALAMAEVDADTISYVEAHGTGTPVGDPIEVAALTRAFRQNTSKIGFCGLGSVKTNIGHLDTAAGVASLIKAALALEHQELPPSLHYQKANPQIDFANSPFYVNASLRGWESNGAPRRAGVTSLGVGGTNAHLILEEAPAAEPPGHSRRYQLLTLSARTGTALDAATDNLVEHLTAHPDGDLADVAYTLHVGRKEFAYRRTLVCRDIDDAITAFKERNPRRVLTGTREDGGGSVVFMFPGGGAQYVNMGRDLYVEEQTFREHVDKCLELLKPQLGFDLKELMFPAEDKAELARTEFEKPSIALPALFTIEYALAQLWMSWGIKPAAMIGHSLGEYAAACLAGVMTLEDALALVTMRGRLFEKLPDGGMLSVPLPAEELRPLMGSRLSFAAINAPLLCVVSGPSDAIGELEVLLAAREVDFHRLHISVAAHSEMVNPIMAEFSDFVKQRKFQAPTIPFVSNLTGTWISAAEATDPNYWVQHLRNTVRFADGVDELLKQPNRSLLEVGPGRTLSTLARQNPNIRGHHAFSSLRHPDEPDSDVAFVLNTVGHLWLRGASVNWSLVHAGERRRRVPLPTYPFERQRYWIERGKDLPNSDMAAASLAKKQDSADWFYIPSWKRSLPPVASNEAQSWLLFKDNTGLGSQIETCLRARGERVITVNPGEKFVRVGEDTYAIDPRNRADYDALIIELKAKEKIPQKVLHLWAITSAGDEMSGQDLFFSLLFLAQACGDQNLSSHLDVKILSNNMQRVAGENLLQPEKALLLGPCRVIPREFPNITCQSIDIILPAEGYQRALVDQLVAEVLASFSDQIIAYRGPDRWVQSFEPIKLDATAAPVAKHNLRENGVYLITGGLGGIGFVLAEYIAKTVQAKLILVGRTVVPDRGEWSDWLKSHDEADSVASRLRKVQHLESLGADVLVYSADVTNKNQMARAILHAQERFGKIDGVVHAAGVLQDDLIQLKGVEAAAHVLAPKVTGTLVLDELLGGTGLDFFVMFSSISSILGLAGQVDYTAANAFLDAFAQHKSARGGVATAINWGAWQEVGMAAGFAESAYPSSAAVQTQEVFHPLLKRRLVNSGDKVIFETELSVNEQWVLNEHRIKDGDALVPGAAYLEIVRAALNEHRPQCLIELRDVLFVAPLIVRATERKNVRIEFTKAGEAFDFVISSREGASRRGEWQENVTGSARYIENAGPPAHTPVTEALSNSNGWKTLETQPHQFLDLGPRWKNLKTLSAHQNEAIIALELSEEFAGDLTQYLLHPSLLDMATAGAQSMIKDYDPHTFYVPLMYSRMTIMAPLPAKIYSHVRYRNGSSQGQGVATFDVTLLDEAGKALVDIEGFTMKRMADKSALISEKVSRRGPIDPADSSPDTEFLRLTRNNAILNAEGVEAFRRIISGNVSPQVVVSSMDLQALADEVYQHAHPAELTQSIELHERPSLQSTYVGPRNAFDRALIEIWQELLGIEQIGIHDDFFALGGHSLLAMRFFSRIRHQFQFQMELTMGKLFELSTIASISDLIRTDDKAEHIERRKHQEQPRISLAQEGLWFLDQLEPGNAAYNVISLNCLKGPLNIEALRQALEAIVARHESLRTTFDTIDGQPVMDIAPRVEVVLAIRDLTAVPESERQRAIQQMAAEPFDLVRGPLFRASLLRIGNEEHVLLVAMHHIVSDLWSIAIFFEELGELYEDARCNRASSLPELPIQYADFAVWQRQWLTGEVLEKQLRYWRAQLTGAPDLLAFPTDHPRPAVQSNRGAHHPLALSPELLAGLRELGRREGATLYMTLLAAFQTLLFRHANQTDIVVGSPIANRTRPEIERVIGFFANTLALRTDLSGDPTFLELLSRVKAVTLGAYDHQDVPFARLVEDLKPERSLSFNPIFQVLFALHTTPTGATGFSHLTVESLDTETGVTRFDLGVDLFEGSQSLTGFIEYNRDLFEPATIERLAGRFRALLEGIVANPELRLSALPVLAETERHSLLHEWNDTISTGQERRCVHELFELQAKQTPDKVSVVFENQQLTYAELNARANQLAHYLRKLGVGPETLVGICVERSLEMMVGLLGILKAGGAYVPLDPTFPEERLRFMIADSHAAVIVSQQRLVDQFHFSEVKTVCLDSDWGAIRKESAANLTGGASVENLAYTIYTSGSTGQPKGVQIEHRSLTNLLCSIQRQPELTANDVWLSPNTFSFDMSVLELYLPLVVGARLVIVSRAVSTDGHQLKEWLRTSGATVVQGTPATWRMLIEAGWEGDDRLLILCGGEAFNNELAAQLLSRSRGVWNMYGPTETTVWSMMCKLEPDVSVSLGRPLDNTEIYLLDETQNLAPQGVVGEVYIGGRGLARGYLRRPELTAERFVKNIFSDDPEARLYKTGDLARCLPDGRIEYLGRRDSQVKVRGHRIELGEIESTLLAHEAVINCAVIVTDRSGDSTLVAYVVPQFGREISSNDLRAFLKRKLPSYMIPSFFVGLERLPLSPNGKIDRTALPAEGELTPQFATAAIPPRDDLERQLARIWQKVLGLSTIGVRDNFFDLGGHSLIAVRLFDKIEKTYDLQLGLATLFESPTIEQQALILRKHGISSGKQATPKVTSEPNLEAWPSLVPIQAKGDKPPFYCIHGFGGNIVEYLHLARYLGPDQPFYGIQARGLDGKRVLGRIEEMAAHYLKEIRAFQPEGPYYFGGSSFGGAVAYEMAQQLRGEGEEVALLALFDTHGPGYPKYLPTTTKFRHHLNNWRFRVDQHRSNLKICQGPQRREYILEKSIKAVRKLKAKIVDRGRRVYMQARTALLPRAVRAQLKLMGHNVQMVSVKPLPLSRGVREVTEAAARAALTYVPGPYNGEVTLFRATIQPFDIYPDRTNGWGGLVGKLKIVDVPGHHGAIIREPRARVLAEKLKACLAEARAAAEETHESDKKAAAPFVEQPSVLTTEKVATPEVNRSPQGVDGAGLLFVTQTAAAHGAVDGGRAAEPS